MMFIIGILLSLLGGAMAVAGFIGIFAPKLLKDRKTGKIHTRGAWASAMVLGLVMFGCGSLLTGDDDEAKQTAADTQTETLQADDSASKPTSEKGYDLTINTQRKDMPISFEELRQRINSQMALLDKPATKSIPETAKPWGDKDSVNFTYQFDASKNISILISANPKNNNPRGITVLAAPAEGSEAIDLLELFAKSIAIQTAPIADGRKESKETAAQILKMATNLAGEFANNPEKQAKDFFVKDGFEYGVALTPGMPFMFTVDVKE